MRIAASREKRIEYFWSRVEKKDCWNWIGGTTTAGYGMIDIRGVKFYTHRLSYELANGKIPEGLVIDHLCRNTRCCNPDHLEAVTQFVNLHRGESLSHKKSLQTHCIHGHSLSDCFIKSKNRRECRECNRLRSERYRAKKGELNVNSATDADRAC